MKKRVGKKKFGRGKTQSLTNHPTAMSTVWPGPNDCRIPKQSQECYHLSFRQQLPAIVSPCLRASGKKNLMTRLRRRLFSQPRPPSLQPLPKLPLLLLPPFHLHQFVPSHSTPPLLPWFPQLKVLLPRPKHCQDFYSLLPPPHYHLLYLPPEFYLRTHSRQAGQVLYSQSEGWEREIRTKYRRKTPVKSTLDI